MEKDKTSCFICRTELTQNVRRLARAERHTVECPTCGDYSISQEAAEDIPRHRHKLSVHIIAGYIREKNLTDEKPILNFEKLKNIEKIAKVPSTLKEKSERLVKYLGTLSDIGKEITISSHYDYPIIYAKDPQELNFLIKSAKEAGLVIGDPPVGKTVAQAASGPIQTQIHELCLTPLGWKKHEALSFPTRAESERLDIQDLIANGESETVEFKSTLCKNLKTKQQDKEIEKSCLKTIVAFLNTDGGTLIIGIEDSGDLIGTQQDVFATEDKMSQRLSNLIQAQIGLEHMPNIDFDFIPYENKKLLVVECRPSDSPVHLTHSGKEEFFIRVGTTTRALIMSKADAYKRKHFQQ